MNFATLRGWHVFKREIDAAFLCGLLFSGCIVPPAPVYRPLVSLRAVPRQADSVNYIPPLFQGFIPWQYGNIQSNLYCWQLQASSNLVDWIEVLNPSCLSDPVTVTASNQFMYFRLKGTL